MFSFSYSSQPASPTHSVGWTSNHDSPGRMSSASGTSRASPTTSVLSGATSVATTGIKTRQIRDLKLEVEMRDQRIDELERLYEETQRKASFAQGELQCRVDEQTLAMSAMESEHTKFRSKVVDQEGQIRELRDTLQQYATMSCAFKEMMTRCAEMERRQKDAEEAAARAAAVAAAEAEKKVEAERAAAAAAEQLLAAEKRAAEERAAAEAARLAEEAARKAAEEEAARKAAEQEAVRKAAEEEAARKAAEEEAARKAAEEARIVEAQRAADSARRAAQLQQEEAKLRQIGTRQQAPAAPANRRQQQNAQAKKACVVM
jgi:vacuolar-type H+-ATPase subunit I/STV1